MRRRKLTAFLGLAGLGWPLPSPAQPSAMPAVGLLSSTSAELVSDALSGLGDGLRESGYVEGRNQSIEFRYAEGRYERLPALAGELAVCHDYHPTRCR